MVDELVVRTTLRAPRSAVFDRLRDVEGYGRYCEYVRSVNRSGDGAVGTEYSIGLAWWTATYEARARLTAVEPPARIGWRTVGDLEAVGAWTLEEGRSTEIETTVTLTVRYDPDGGDADLSLPAFVPTAALVELARPVAEREAGRIASRLAADLEGVRREPEISITHRRDVG